MVLEEEDEEEEAEDEEDVEGEEEEEEAIRIMIKSSQILNMKIIPILLALTPIQTMVLTKLQTSYITIQISTSQI